MQSNDQQIVTVPVQEKLYDHRFQRTDQWKPVYTWLESLNTDEVVKSQDVVDWLNSNPVIRDDLYTRHSRYHLTHYIKKCHVKILKRKEKQGLIIAKLPPSRADQNAETKNPASPHFTGNTSSSTRKDSDLYKAKQIEALRKYEIITQDEIEELISKLQVLLPDSSSSRRNSRVVAPKILKDTCKYIKKLHKEVDDLSCKLAQLVSSGDISSVDDLDIIRRVLQQ